MDEIRKPHAVPPMFDVGSSFAQISSDAARQLCEQGQVVAKTMTEWTTEVGQFFNHRLARNGEAFARIAKCPGVAEVFAVEAEWVRDAAEDYFKEMQKLTELNGKIVGNLTAGQFEAAARPTKASMRSVS